MIEEELRRRFESLNRDSYGFRRSRKGNYVNPVIARDWKWFRQGHQTQPEAVVAMGESWVQLRSMLAIAMLGRGGRPDRTMETINAVLDAITEPGLPLAFLRAAPDWRLMLPSTQQAVVDAATALVKEVCERHDTRNPPHKYAVPYGAVVTLMESLKLKAEGT